MAAMTDSPSTFDVPRTDGSLPVLRWTPPSGEGPGIVVIQEIFGVSPYVRNRCADLAAAGYVVHCPDLYFRLGEVTFDEGADDYVQQGIAASQRLDWEQTRDDASATLDALRADSSVTGAVALLGFCFGGGLAFDVASRNTPDALVSYYGSALPGLLDRAPEVTCPQLHHFGTADAFFPMATVDTIRDAVTADRDDVTFVLHAGANHAFDNPYPPLHQAHASAVAWRITLGWLEQALAGR